MSILGNPVRRVEDPRMLTGAAQFVADLALPATPAHAVYVRSPFAHARIVSIDPGEALAMPGVLDVVTAADLDVPPPDPLTPLHDPTMVRSPLASTKVRFAGEPVAVVVAETPAQGQDAAEAVLVDYEPLDVLVDPEAALGSATKLYEEAESNVAVHIPAPAEISFDECEVVVEARLVNNKIGPSPIEPRVAAAYWDDDDRLVHLVAAQGTNGVRDQLAAAMGLDVEQVRVVIPDVGGGFGAKGLSHPEDTILGVLAKRAGRPVAWVETRTESMAALGHARGQIQYVTVGGSRDGRITHYRFENVQDCGAYPAVGGFLPMLTGMMAVGTYAIPNVEYSARCVVTNTSPVCAFRGAGRPEAAAAIERAVDLFAAEVGISPVEVRRRNYIARDAFPFTTPTTPMPAVYDSGDYEASLDMALEAAGYEELREDQARRRELDDSRVLGIGIATYVEVTAVTEKTEYGDVRLNEDGTVVATTGSIPFGQGHVTTWAMIVSDRLGVPMEDIEVVHGDSDLAPSVGTSAGSRSVQIAGTSMHDAAGRLVDAAKRHAADLLEAAVDDVVLDTEQGAFHVVGTPARAVDWADVAAAAAEPLMGVADVTQDGPSFPFGTHVAVVEVDLETGGVELLRLVAVDDAGRILNPLLATGQVHGGLASGCAQALLEEIRYDDAGHLLTSNFADYAVISAAELPSFERIEMETPTPLNALGAKGIGESGTVGATPAVQNAVVDALSHLGVRHIDLPLTAERVWRAISDGR